MHNGTPFGRWLREQRRARDLTQDGIGAQVGCAGETIRKIEAGAARPSRQVAELLAAYLAVPAADWPDFVRWARLLPARPGEASTAGSGATAHTGAASSAATDPASSLLRTPHSILRIPLERPEGTMDPHSAFYVERPSDAPAGATMRQPGVTITIKGPRQMGKSSLLYRLLDTAQAVGKRVVLLDFQLVDAAALATADAFLRQFCAWLSDELGITEQVDDYWRLPVGPMQRCTNYLKKYLLPQVGGPLVLAMDEVDKIFDTPYRSDFFAMLRSWHNTRQAGSVWCGLDLVLVTSTEPYQFVENLNQSPFNVGCTVELEDFTPTQVADLNERHGAPLTPAEARRLMALVGGQPYLVRRALYLIATGQLTPDALFATAQEERGPFGDHLRAHLLRLHEAPDLVAGLRGILRNRICADERIYFRLRGAGLVRRDGTAVLPRYPLYEAYFREHLRG